MKLLSIECNDYRRKLLFLVYYKNLYFEINKMHYGWLFLFLCFLSGCFLFPGPPKV